MPPRTKTLTPWLSAVLLVAVIVLAGRLDLGARIDEFRAWIDSFGRAGPIVFVAAYVVAVVLAVPGSALTVSAGVLFGPIWGVVLVSAGSTVGAALAFLISRYLARDRVARWTAGHERFARIDRLSEEQGWMVVLLTRLVPVFPFNLLNYGFGLTRVRFGTYVLWSWVGMLPGTVVYVVGGDTIRRALGGNFTWGPVVGLIVAVAIVGLIVRQARRSLERKEASIEPRGDR